jgi:hypothetical protein
MRGKWKTDVGQMVDRMILEWNGIVQASYIQYSIDDKISDIRQASIRDAVYFRNG